MPRILQEKQNREKTSPNPEHLHSQGTGTSELTKRIQTLSEQKAELEVKLAAAEKNYDIKINILEAKASREAREAGDKAGNKVRAELLGDLDKVSLKNTELLNKNAGIEREIKKCNNEKKELTTSIESIGNELNKELKSKKALEAELEAKKNALEQKELELKAKKIDVNVYQCQEYKDEIKKLKLQIQSLTRNIETKKTNIDVKKAEISSLKLEVQKNSVLQKELERYKAEVRKQSSNLAKAAENLTKVREEAKEAKEAAVEYNEGVKAYMTANFATRIREITQEKEELNTIYENLKKNCSKRLEDIGQINVKLMEDKEILKTEKASHEAGLKKLKTEKADFDSQILDLDRRLKNAEKLRKDEKEESAKVVEGLRKGVDKLTRDKGELKSKLNATEDAKNLASSNIARLDEQIKTNQFATTQLNTELDKVRKELGESKERYTTVYKELSELQREKEELKSQNKLTSSELKVYKSKEGDLYVELNQQLDSLKQSNARLSKLQIDLESQLRTCNSNSIQKDATILKLQKERDALQEEKDECEKEKVARISELNTIRLDLEGKLAKITQEKEKSDSEIKSLKQNTEVIEQRLSEDQQQKEEQIKLIDIEIMKTKSDYESRIQSLSLDIDSKEAMISRLKTELQESIEGLKTCNSSNEFLKTEKEKLNKELETCRKQRKTVENHLNERIKNLNTQLDELRSEKQYLEQSRSEFKVKSKDRLGYEQEQFNEQLRKLNETIKLKDEEISNVKEELENLRKEYNEKEQNLLSEIERKNSEIEKIEGRLQASEFSLKTEREESLKLLKRIKELDLARKDAEEVNKAIENDRIELQKGITSRHSEIQRLERELESVKRKLTELENNPSADFDAYNQGMEEAKQNYIQKIQELQSRISGFETDKNQMEKQLEDCTKVRLELSSKINDLEKLVENLNLENEKLKVENADLVKQVKDREAGSVKLNEKLKVENQKLVKEREMYSSQFQETQKLQTDNTRYEEIVKSLQEKLQAEILKNRGEKSVIENEYRQSLETIEELNKQLETSKKLLNENSSKLLQTQQMQALQSFQSSQASQDKIKELEYNNNLLREEITKISEQLRLKNSEISREGSSRILEIKNEEERLTGILKRLNTEIGFSEHQLRQLQENISKKKDISVVSSFNLSINDEEYDRIQRIIRNVERVTKKCDKLSVSKMSK